MRRHSILFGLILAMLASPGLGVFSGAWAQEVQITPTKYQFTMKKLELCTESTCTGPTLLAEKDQVFDIGSAVANPGQSVGTYVESISLPIGTTFTHWRGTMDRRFTLSGGTVNGLITGAGACFTDGTGTGTAGTATTGARTTDADASGRGSAASDMTLVVPNAVTVDFGNLTATYAAAELAIVDGTTMTFTQALAQPHTVANKPPALSVTFNVASTLDFTGTGADSCLIFFEPPAVTVTIQ